jgi:hypothetical protein
MAVKNFLSRSVFAALIFRRPSQSLETLGARQKIDRLASTSSGINYAPRPRQRKRQTAETKFNYSARTESRRQSPNLITQPESIWTRQNSPKSKSDATAVAAIVFADAVKFRTRRKKRCEIDILHKHCAIS